MAVSSTNQLQLVYIEPVNQLKQTRILPGIELCRSCLASTTQNNYKKSKIYNNQQVHI